jgi:curved DNA-binding protein CbpA
LQKNYYQILGLNSNASLHEIKKKYHELAFLYHPDTSSIENAHILFSELNEAYSVLSNEIKKKKYDYFLNYGSFQRQNKTEQKNSREQYKKYGTSKKNSSNFTKSTQNGYATEDNKKLDKTIYKFEKFMYYTLLFCGLLGFVFSLFDLYTKGYTSINSINGLVFAIVFNTLLISIWNYFKPKYKKD